jgi:hypothetical protein
MAAQVSAAPSTPHAAPAPAKPKTMTDEEVLSLLITLEHNIHGGLSMKTDQRVQILDSLYSLIESQGHSEATTQEIARVYLLFFQSTSTHIGGGRNDNPLLLSEAEFQTAFAKFTTLSNNPHLPACIRKALYQSLPYILNHAGASYTNQRDAFHLINSFFAHDPQERLAVLKICLSLPYWSIAVKGLIGESIQRNPFARKDGPLLQVAGTAASAAEAAFLAGAFARLKSKL